MELVYHVLALQAVLYIDFGLSHMAPGISRAIPYAISLGVVAGGPMIHPVSVWATVGIYILATSSAQIMNELQAEPDARGNEELSTNVYYALAYKKPGNYPGMIQK